MRRPSKNTQELTRLRALVRRILLEDGTALAPTSPVPEPVDDAIAELATVRTPTLQHDSDAVLEAISNRDIKITVSNHFGHLMAVYGDAGYFVGMCMGLELTRLLIAD